MWGGFWGGPCHCLASGSLPGTHPVSSHFTPFLCVTGTLPAALMVLNPRVCGFAYILRLCWPFKWWIFGSFFCHPNLCWFLQPIRNWEVPGIYLPSTGTLGCAVWPWGLDRSLPRVSLISFCRWCHSTVSATLPLLPFWMNVASLNPWLSDFHTAQLSDGSGYY